MRKLTLLIAAGLVSLVAPLALALLVVGCAGSAGSGYSSGPTGSTSQAGGSGGVAGVAVRTTSIGPVVVNGNGRTVYLFEKDKNGTSACYDQCAKYWPPLITHGMPSTGAGADPSLLGTSRRADGSEQITYANQPLYLYAFDTAPGDVNGEGSKEFGAEWDALTPAGQKIEPAS
jgi:predicted lipoprotein with Yx(FWY)xxD motif